MLGSIRHGLPGINRFTLLAPAVVSLILGVLVSPTATAYADDCTEHHGHGICGELYNHTDQLIRVSGDADDNRQHYCDVPPGADSHRCTEFHDVDYFTFPNYNNFRVCWGRFCANPSLHRAGEWYQMHDTDAWCDHPRGHYARCRIFAEVFPESPEQRAE
jgi:hypothetical protein